MIELNKNQKFLKFFYKINFKIFILFVIISSFFWIVTKFSNIYKFENEFYIKWTNIPETIIIDKAQKKISVLFSASGFEILIYKIFVANIEISLDKDVFFENNIGRIDVEKKILEIENQFFENNKIENLITKEISFNYSVNLLSKLSYEIGMKFHLRHLPHKPNL